MNIKLLIEPQPEWQETPEAVTADGILYWAGRYRYMRHIGPEECAEDEGCDYVRPPTEGLVPEEIDGQWYWITTQPNNNLSDAPKDGGKAP